VFITGTNSASYLAVTNSILISGGNDVVLDVAGNLCFYSAASGFFKFGASAPGASDGSLFASMANISATINGGIFTNSYANWGVDRYGTETASNLFLSASATIGTNLTLGSLTNSSRNAGIDANGLATVSNLFVTANSTLKSNLLVLGSTQLYGVSTNNTLTSVSNAVWGVAGGAVTTGWTNTTARQGLLTLTLVGSGGSGFGAYCISTNWDGTFQTNFGWGFSANVGTCSNSFSWNVSSNTSSGIVVTAGSVVFGSPASIKWK
jgi:hypothetical protein